LFYTDVIERGANAVGMSIPPLETTESAAIKSMMFYAKWVYNAARGIVSRDIT
jgi:hypothetical protein